jgi:hypothetical protein
VERATDNQKTWISDTDRILQTSMSYFFQQGQTSEASDDAEVYKIPAPGACKHCLSLHLKPDGSPKLYKLADVRGESNIGVPQYAWSFTLGPVHPHCYCLLFFAEQDAPPKANKDLAAARADALQPKKTADLRKSVLELFRPLPPEILRLIEHLGVTEAKEPIT